MHYHHWRLRKEAKYFDFMDIGNHILRQMKMLSDQDYSEEVRGEVYGQLGEPPELNYLFLD